MPNPMMRIHDIETNEVIDREMTDKEFLEYKEMCAQAIERQNKELEKSTARQNALAKLAALGLTEDEIAAL